MKLSQVLELIPPHDPEDSIKVNEIASSLEAKGWEGQPLVYHYGKLITGSHRYAALEKADIPYSFEIPCLCLSEIFQEADLDLSEIMTEEGSDEAWDGAWQFVLNSLPSNITEKYGIQY